MKVKKHKIFVIVGDGEINEGSFWETSMMVAKHKLSNFNVLIDYNKIQSYGKTSEVLNLEPLKEKWISFGFNVSEVDGHDVDSLRNSFLTHNTNPGKPIAFICHTTKGKGLPMAENQPSWHYKNNFSSDQIAEMRRACEFS